VNGLHHPLQHRIEKLARVLGIPVGEELLEPFRSANSTVICFRSPSRALREVRIRSAMCFGV
jgi:hypothetical protein